MDGKAGAAAAMGSGDLVFIYEFASGPELVKEYVDGQRVCIARLGGRMGLVALATVLQKPFERKDEEPESYSDGTTRWWRYYAPTRAVNSRGFVPREVLCRTLGYEATYAFRGFGEHHSGLGEITADQFGTLHQLFVDACARDEEQLAVSVARFGYCGGGEGPEHLALKQALAADPSRMLGEEGLRLWRTEYALPTNDRIDVVLKDRHNRFVVVEIEVDCDETEIVGPLQCMKYRALMSYLFKQPLDEVRAVLVAHSIHSAVAQRCSMHSIQCSVWAR